jgi:membrane-bound metal-dependent hydrolase YbcI (DUF457 family)
MNRRSHVLVGAAAGAGLAVADGQGPLLAAATVLVAAAAAPIPDLDNASWWKTLDRVVPDEVLGHGGPMRHRGLMHWWVLPVVFTATVTVAAPIEARWALLAAAAGWGSHIVADFLVGARSPYRGPGVPVAPWWWHVGLGLHNGSVPARVVESVVVAFGVWAVLVLTGLDEAVVAVVRVVAG